MSFPEIRVGEPMRCEAMTVFPLFSERSLLDRTPDYVLGHDAIEAKTVTVCEVSEQGEVPSLFVDNAGDSKVLLLEGSELRGVKQHRMLNTSVLVGGRSRTRIPVACVERGRWRYELRQSGPGSHCPPSLRHLLKGSAGSRVRGSHQIALWAEIGRKHRALGVASTTGDLSAALEAHRERVEQVQKQIPYPASANGVAVAFGGRLISIDILDKATTLEKVWSRMTQGLAMDALEAGKTEREVTGAEVSAAIGRFRQADWQQVEAVALGEEFRIREDTMPGSALFFEGELLHAAWLPCNPA
jgi:hypothetical protein